MSALGIGHKQSSRWQQVAAVPEPEFGRHLVDLLGADGGGGVGQLHSGQGVKSAAKSAATSAATGTNTTTIDTNCGEQIAPT